MTGPQAAFYNCLSSQRLDTQYRHLQTLIVSYGMVRLYVCLFVCLSVSVITQKIMLQSNETLT